MSEDVGPAPAGWYPLPQTDLRGREVRYWNGTEWIGQLRPATRDWTRPRDFFGTLALILLVAGFVGTILVPVFESALTLTTVEFTTSLLIVLAVTPIALIVSIAGLVRAHQYEFQAPLSLVSLILSALGSVLLVLPIALFATGVWSIHI
jgi:hypothetical protein